MKSEHESDGRGSLLAGMAVCWLLNIAELSIAWLLVVADVRMLPAYYVLVWAIGVVQVGYVVPLWRLLVRQGLRRTAEGLLAAAALTALANAVLAVVVFGR